VSTLARWMPARCANAFRGVWCSLFAPLWEIICLLFSCVPAPKHSSALHGLIRELIAPEYCQQILLPRLRAIYVQLERVETVHIVSRMH